MRRSTFFKIAFTISGEETHLIWRKITCLQIRVSFLCKWIVEEGQTLSILSDAGVVPVWARPWIEHTSHKSVGGTAPAQLFFRNLDSSQYHIFRNFLKLLFELLTTIRACLWNFWNWENFSDDRLLITMASKGDSQSKIVVQERRLLLWSQSLKYLADRFKGVFLWLVLIGGALSLNFFQDLC